MATDRGGLWTVSTVRTTGHIRRDGGTAVDDITAGDITADTVGIDEAGRRADALASELQSVRTGWATGTDSPGAALGYDELEAAFTACQDAWFAELGVSVAALELIGANLAGSASTYTAADHSAAAGFHGLW